VLSIPSPSELTKLIEDKVAMGVGYIDATIEVARTLGVDVGELGKQLPPKVRQAVKDEAIRNNMVRRVIATPVIPFD
jgi:hypothetical protein